MKIQEYYSLLHLNTFHIDTRARYFVEVSSVEDFLALLDDPIFLSQPHLILWGGSNMLFTQDFDGLVIRMDLKGIEIVDNGKVLVKAMAGETWHDFVTKTLDMWLCGLENLSLIPGTVGAAPVQNIGAYGVEAGDLIHSAEWLEYGTKRIHSLTAKDCGFGYRESIFKHELKGKWVVLSVTFHLKTYDPRVYEPKIEYGAIREQLSAVAIITPKAVSDAIVSIRESKLPDPNLLGNAGSFFKNPFIKKEQLDAIIAKYEKVPSYPTDDPLVFKIAAGWLIEQSGLKWYRHGDAGVHEKQALVLVNHGSATGEEIFSLAQFVQKTVLEKFGLELEMEVNLL